MDSFADALAGAAGTVVGKTFTYPLDYLKVRLQVSGLGVTQDQIVSEVYRKEGVLGFYAGLGPKVMKSSTQKFIMFYLQRLLSGLYAAAFLKGTGQTVSTGVYMVISYLGEMLGLPLVLPIEVVVTRVQTSKTGEGALDVLRDIRNSKGGFRGLYRVFPAYVFTCCQPGIQFPVFELLKRFFLKRQRMLRVGATGAGARLEPQLGWGEAFIAGAISKAIGQTVTFPFERTRSKYMTLQKQGAENLSVFQVLRDIYAEEGFGFPFFGGLWKGVENDLSQGILNAALMMMVKEQLFHVVRNMVLGFQKR